MNSRNRLLYAACALAATVALSSCGNRQPEQRTAAKQPKPAASAQQPKSNPSPQSGSLALGNLPGLGTSQDSGNMADIFKPSSADPSGLGSSAPSSPISGPVVGKAAPIPVKPLSPTVRPEPKQLLLLVQNVYRAAKTISVSGSASLTVKQDGKVVMNQPSESFTNTYKLPAKFILSSSQTKISCDGKNLSQYYAPAKQYRKVPFTKDVARELAFAKPGISMTGLLFGIDYSEGIQSSKLLPDAKVAGQDTFVLQLRFKNGVGGMPNTSISQTLWISKSDLLIYKNRVVATQKPTAPKGYTGKVPKSIETTIVNTLSTAKYNPKISDSAFAFKAPAGAKPVEAPKNVDITGKPAPDFTYTATDGSNKKLSDLKGKPVILIFWGLPMPKAQFDLLKDACGTDRSKAEVVTINLNREQDKVKSFLKGKGESIPLIFANESIAKAAVQGYGLRGLPSMLIIDRSGIIRLATIGIPDQKDLSAKLQKYAPAN